MGKHWVKRASLFVVMWASFCPSGGSSLLRLCVRVKCYIMCLGLRCFNLAQQYLSLLDEMFTNSVLSGRPVRARNLFLGRPVGGSLKIHPPGVAGQIDEH